MEMEMGMRMGRRDVYEYDVARRERPAGIIAN